MIFFRGLFMKKLILVLFFLFLSSGFAADIYVAVVETKYSNDVISYEEQLFVTDKLRESAKNVLPYYGYVVMTRENISVMLDPSKSLEECVGECLVTTGANIGADFVSQARIGRFGERFTMTVELYHTKSKSLVSSFTVMSSGLEELLDEMEEKSINLYGKIVEYVAVNSEAEDEVASEEKFESVEEEPVEDEPVDAAALVESASEPEEYVDVSEPYESEDAFAAKDGYRREVPQDAVPKVAEVQNGKGVHWLPLVISGAALAGGVVLAVMKNAEAKDLSEKDDIRSEKDLDKRLDDIRGAQNMRAIGIGISALGALGIVLSIAL